MPEHYSKNVIEVSYWCRVCHRTTMHYVWNGRLGDCKQHVGRKKIAEEKAQMEKEIKKKQGELF